MLIHEGHTRVRSFFTPANAASYDSVVRLATFGQDSAWKREIIKTIAYSKSVLELACGTGVLSSMLIENGREVIGIDLTFEYLRTLRRKLQTKISQGTAEALPYRDESFDAVASSYLIKYVDVSKVVNECWRVLKPGGVVIFHDFTYPIGMMKALWNAHFALLQLAGIFMKSWKIVFDQLDNVIKNSDWIDQTTRTLHSRGFRNINHKFYTAGTAAIIHAEKP